MFDLLVIILAAFHRLEFCIISFRWIENLSRILEGIVGPWVIFYSKVPSTLLTQKREQVTVSGNRSRNLENGCGIVGRLCVNLGMAILVQGSIRGWKRGCLTVTALPVLVVVFLCQ